MPQPAALTPSEYMPADYWRARSHLNYYAEVRQWIEELSAKGSGSILDVGGYDTPVVTWGKFRRRYTIDAVLDPKFPGVRSDVGDFMTWPAPERMDVVVCLQVIEHVQEAAAFGAKLLRTGRNVIVSVPYCWPAGKEPSHVHDPIDVHKLASFMSGRRPDRARIVADGKLRRLVGLWTT